MKCPACDFIERDELWGDPATCPKCGAVYEKAVAARQAKEAMLANQEREKSQASIRKTKQAQKVIVTNIDIPFWSMVRFMVMWALAAIPAATILAILFWGLVSIISLL